MHRKWQGERNAHIACCLKKPWQDNSEVMHPATDQHRSDIKPQVSTSLTGCLINCFGTGGGREEIFPKPCLNVLPQLMNVSKWNRTEI